MTFITPNCLGHYTGLLCTCPPLCLVAATYKNYTYGWSDEAKQMMCWLTQFSVGTVMSDGEL